MMLHCRISSAHPNSKLEKVSRKKFGVTLTKKEHFLFPRNISNPQIQNKLQVNSEDVMDDLMPQTLAQPLTGTGGLRWYLGQILLFPELGGPSPAPRGHNDAGVWGLPQASSQAQRGPQRGPEDAECSGGGLTDSRMLGTWKAW